MNHGTKAALMHLLDELAREIAKEQARNDTVTQELAESNGKLEQLRARRREIAEDLEASR